MDTQKDKNGADEGAQNHSIMYDQLILNKGVKKIQWGKK